MRYVLEPDRTEVVIHATSSIHPIRTVAQGFGWFDTGPDDASEATGELTVDLRALRSGNPLIDREAERRLDVRRHPSVHGVLTGLVRPAGSGPGIGAGRLTLRGVTADVGGELTVVASPRELRLDGELAIDVGDFGIQPPSLLVVKVHPQIRVELHAVGSPA